MIVSRGVSFVFWGEFLSSIPPDNGANCALLYTQAGIADLRGSRQGLKVSLFFTPTLFNPKGLNREGRQLPSRRRRLEHNWVLLHTEEPGTSRYKIEK